VLAAALAALAGREPGLREAERVRRRARRLWLLTPVGRPVGARLSRLSARGSPAIFVLAPLASCCLGRGRRLDRVQLSLAAPALMAVTYDGSALGHGPEPSRCWPRSPRASALASGGRGWRAWRLGDEAPLVALPREHGRAWRSPRC
jgi:hypothetical protein